FRSVHRRCGGRALGTGGGVDARRDKSTPTSAFPFFWSLFPVCRRPRTRTLFGHALGGNSVSRNGVSETACPNRVWARGENQVSYRATLSSFGTARVSSRSSRHRWWRPGCGG